MARAIDADELRREFYNNTDYGHYAMCMDGSEVEFTMNEVFRIIDNAPTIEPKQEWISVKDRLPERLKEVLICFDDYGRKSVSVATYRDYFYGKEWLSNMVSLSVDCFTQWIQLPEPPER